MISNEPTTVSEATLSEHADFVRRLARRLVKDEHQVDDLVQETWLAALRQQPRLRGSLRGWLARVMSNLVASEHRSRARREQREASAVRSGEETALDELAALASGRRVIARAVLALAEPYRSAVMLRYYEGLGPAEIAARLHVPVETVRTRIERALAMLRVSLDRESEGGRRLWLVPLPWLELFRRARGAIRGAERRTVARLRSHPTSSKLALAAAVPFLALVALFWWRDATVRGHVAAAPSVALADQVRLDGTRATRPALDGERAPASSSAAGAPTPLGAQRIVTGRTLDAQGRALAGVELRWWAGSELGAGEPSGTARSDERGSFSLSDLPDTFVVDASSAFGTAVETLQGVGVELGTYDGVDFCLDVVSSLRGTVVDELGRPVAGVQLTTVLGRANETYRASHHRSLAFYRRTSASAASDERGAFVLAGLDSGSHRVLARHPEFPDSLTRVATSSEPIEIRLRAGVASSLQVVDDARQPLAGARVTVRASNGSTSVATTGNDGRCELPPRAEHAQIYARVERDGFGPLLAGPWTISADQPLHSVQLRAPRSVAGRVVDSSGNSIAGARIAARFALDRRRTDDSGFAPLRELGMLARVLGDADGAFHFEGLPAEALQLDVQTQGETWPTSSVSLSANDTSLTIVLERRRGSAELELAVRDGLVGSPVRAFTATVIPQSDASDWGLVVRAFETPDGRARWSELAAGPALLFVDAPGCASALVPCDLDAARACTLDVELFPLRDLRLRAVRADGTPLSPANLLITDREGRPVLARAKPRQTRSLVPVGPLGEAELGELPASVVRVEVLVPGHDFGPLFDFDLTRPIEGVQTLQVLDDAFEGERNFPLTFPSVWRGQRVDVVVADGDSRPLSRFRSAAGSAEIVLTGGRSTLYCHREAGNRVREAWNRALPRWFSAEDEGDLPADGTAPNELRLNEISAPARACRLLVSLAGRVVLSVSLAAGEPSATLDLAQRLERAND